MKDKEGKLAFALQAAIYATIAISIIVWVRCDFRAFVMYYKDFAVNVGIACLTAYLLLTEKRLKYARNIAFVTAWQLDRAKDMVDEVFTLEKYKEFDQRAQEAHGNLKRTEGKKDNVTWFLACFTILSAVLSIFGYFLEAVPC